MEERDQQGLTNLENEKRKNEADQQVVKNQINDLDEHISRLRSAYDAIGESKHEIEYVQEAIACKARSYGGSWKGRKYDCFLMDCSNSGGLHAAYQFYINEVDWIQDSINEEIYRLECQKSEKYGILQGLVNAWNRVVTDIRNYWN